jgi:hypothetical protein
MVLGTSTLKSLLRFPCPENPGREKYYRPNMFRSVAYYQLKGSLARHRGLCGDAVCVNVAVNCWLIKISSIPFLLLLIVVAACWCGSAAWMRSSQLRLCYQQSMFLQQGRVLMAERRQPMAWHQQLLRAMQKLPGS